MKILAIASAASGSALLYTFLDFFKYKNDTTLDVIFTKTAAEISLQETGRVCVPEGPIAHVYDNESFYSPPSSGSTFDYNVVVVIPASAGFLSRVSLGLSSNLAERSFDVAIKEGTKIVVVPREMPFSRIHLESLLRLSNLGVVICPATLS